MFNNLGNIVQQAKKMKENMAKVDETLNRIYVKGVSTSNFIEVDMSCKGDFRSVKIGSQLLQDKDMLEKLLLEALNDAREQANQKTTDIIREATGGIDLPSSILPFK